MGEIIIILLIVAGAAGYIVWNFKKSISKPNCSCGNEDNCPYSENQKPADCVLNGKNKPD